MVGRVVEMRFSLTGMTAYNMRWELENIALVSSTTKSFEKIDGLFTSLPRKRQSSCAEFPGFRLSLAIAISAGMTPESCSELIGPQHQGGE
jgi:hypothetical protein